MTDTIELNIDDSSITAALDRLIKAGSHPGKALDAIGAHVVSLINLGFRDSEDPYGKKWAPLTGATKKRRRKGPGNSSTIQILRDTGILQNSITHSLGIGGQSVDIGTNIEYGIHHQFGTKHIPQRAFLPTESIGIPLAWEQDMLDILSKHIAKALE
jgi:phage gpG-like protein